MRRPPECFALSWGARGHTVGDADSTCSCFNSLRPRQNRHHFADDIFKCIFLNENVWIAIKISLKFVPKGPINNIPALVQITAWHRPGDKPLSEAMMVSLPTHICVTRPECVKGSLTTHLLIFSNKLAFANKNDYSIQTMNSFTFWKYNLFASNIRLVCCVNIKRTFANEILLKFFGEGNKVVINHFQKDNCGTDSVWRVIVGGSCSSRRAVGVLLITGFPFVLPQHLLFHGSWELSRIKCPAYFGYSVDQRCGRRGWGTAAGQQGRKHLHLLSEGRWFSVYCESCRRKFWGIPSENHKLTWRQLCRH